MFLCVERKNSVATMINPELYWMTVVCDSFYRFSICYADRHTDEVRIRTVNFFLLNNTKKNTKDSPT